ncbi:MAG: hypothetical protein M1607_04375 [Patescibacteria group bacterium]|nr:hypothetical protein [Patescibacteria group bacterium]
MQHQSGFTPILLLVGVFLGAAFAGAFYLSKHSYGELFQKQSAPKSCFYQKIQCIQAPCDPVLVCPSSSPTPTLTPMPAIPNDINKLFTYELPRGWSVKYQDKDFIQLVSADYEENLIPDITKGSEIMIKVSNGFWNGHNPPANLDELSQDVINHTNLDKYKKVDQILVANQPALKQFSCWEGCAEIYYLLNNKNVWTISFITAPIASSSTEIDSSPYAKDRDIFLNSLKFADQMQTTDISNWKTYTNEKYGYSFKYPNLFIVSVSTDPLGPVDTTEISNYKPEDFNSLKVNPDDKNVFLMFIRNPYGKDINLETAKKEYGYPKVEMEDYFVGGVGGFRVVHGDTVVVYNHKRFVFQLRNKESNYASYFDQILSTFKFTN